LVLGQFAAAPEPLRAHWISFAALHTHPPATVPVWAHPAFEMHVVPPRQPLPSQRAKPVAVAAGAGASAGLRRYPWEVLLAPGTALLNQSERVSVPRVGPMPLPPVTFGAAPASAPAPSPAGVHLEDSGPVVGGGLVVVDFAPPAAKSLPSATPTDMDHSKASDALA
jgi:hypothetical protein